MGRLGYKKTEKDNIVEYEIESIQYETKNEIIDKKIVKTLTLYFPRYIRISKRKRFEKLILVKTSDKSDYYQKKSKLHTINMVSFDINKHQNKIDEIEELLYRCDYKRIV